MGKTRDLFKKIGYIKGVFHAKMGTIKDRNSKDLIEGEDIKKRWQENTEEPYEKCLNKQDNDNGVVSHLEPDILECEVKKVLGSITMNKAGDGIPAELFKILKYDAAFNVLANLKNSAAVTGLEKVSFHFNPKEGQCQKMFRLPPGRLQAMGCTESDITEVTKHTGMKSKSRGSEAKRTCCVQGAAKH